jgi:hypothetical protein
MAINPAGGGATTLTVTNLHSNANSATNIWCSQTLTKASGAVNAFIQITLDFANTAPANSRAAFVYALSSLDNTTFTQPWNGSEGDQTIPDFTTTPLPLRRIGVIPYTTADEVVEWNGWYCNGGGIFLPPYYGIGIIVHGGAALAASVNEIKVLEYIGT